MRFSIPHYLVVFVRKVFHHATVSLTKVSNMVIFTRLWDWTKNLIYPIKHAYLLDYHYSIGPHFSLKFWSSGDSKNSFLVAKDDAPIVDITWPLTNPRAVYSSLTVSGENLEKLRPYLESGKLKAVIDPTGPYNFGDVIEAFRYLETGRARGKVVISPFPSQHLPSSIPSERKNNVTSEMDLKKIYASWVVHLIVLSNIYEFTRAGLACHTLF